MVKDMKKIGILTYHRSVNNGAVMQAYSLATRLKNLYPNAKVEIIDYHMKIIDNTYRYTFWSMIKSNSVVLSLKKAFQLLKDPKKIKYYNERTEIFSKVLNILPLSEFSQIDNSTAKLFDYINECYDVVIVGSDAVWNYASRGFPNAYFPGKEVRCRKLSYAASCYGMEYESFATDNRDSICEILNGFDFIGVRDSATENFVKWSGCKNMPIHTCDPTAFLDVDKLPVDKEKLKKKLEDRGFDFNRPTIGLMGTEKMCSMIRRFYGKKYQIIALYEYVPSADVNLYDLTPYEWAYVFRYFKLVFTTFFHGTMLSLRNGIPLICIALETDFSKKHTTKTLDVLTRMGYADWYFKTDYKTENLYEIKNKADELMAGDYKTEILMRINQEAESFNEFKNVLDEIILQGDK